MRASIDGNENIQAVSGGGGLGIHNYATPSTDREENPHKSHTYYHQLLVSKSNTILWLCLVSVVVSFLVNFLTLYSLEKHQEQSRLAFDYFKEKDISEGELVNDAVTQILVAINSATMPHQDKAFINSAVQQIIAQTEKQTTHWELYFAGRDSLREERRQSNKNFMDRADKTLTSLDNRLTLLENGGGVNRR